MARREGCELRKNTSWHATSRALGRMREPRGRTNHGRGANMVCRLPLPSSASAPSSPVGIGRGASGSYSSGVLSPTRFAVALIRSSWVMS